LYCMWAGRHYMFTYNMFTYHACMPQGNLRIYREQDQHPHDDTLILDQWQNQDPEEGTTHEEN
jgi:hypothetical protein